MNGENNWKLEQVKCEHIHVGTGSIHQFIHLLWNLMEMNPFSFLIFIPQPASWRFYHHQRPAVIDKPSAQLSAEPQCKAPCHTWSTSFCFSLPGTQQTFLFRAWARNWFHGEDPRVFMMRHEQAWVTQGDQSPEHIPTEFGGVLPARIVSYVDTLKDWRPPPLKLHARTVTPPCGVGQQQAEKYLRGFCGQLWFLSW